jgi:DNA-binding winged helix-turn-helix (wHTH) protein/tetratricopeptide (TPR) repeat protein
MGISLVGQEFRQVPVRFAGFRFEADGALFRGEELVHLPPRELGALRILLANAGQIVSPLQLKQALWGEVHVTADSVPRCLSSLRAHLHPDDCIQTVYKRGYRLLAEVRPVDAPTEHALPRLAVAPFTTGTGVPAHLGPSIAEETIARLSNAASPLVSVLARDSVFSLAAGGATAQQIGDKLKADLVMAGTLRAFPTRLRLRVEMIRVCDGVQIWVEDMLVDRGTTAAGEAELVNRLHFRLSLGAGGLAAASVPESGGPEDGGPEDAGPTGTGGSHGKAHSRASATRLASLHARAEWGGEVTRLAAGAEPGIASTVAHGEAYELFLRGHHEWQTLERHCMQDGMRHLMRAIELDPGLIAAKIDLVHLCVTQGIYGFMSPAVAAETVVRTAESISDLHLRAARILPALAWVSSHYDRNLPAALGAFAQSAHLPHDPWTTRMRSMFALSRHRFQEAIELLRSAIDLDPYSAWLQNRLAWALHLDGQREQSIAVVERTLDLFPDHEGTALYGAMILAWNADAARAVRLAETLARREPYFDLANMVEAYALACAGNVRGARALLERLQWISRERYVLRSFTPAIHVALGDLDGALAELNAANQLRCPWFLQTLADPRLKQLHGHPEFERLRAIPSAMEFSLTGRARAQA